MIKGRILLCLILMLISLWLSSCVGTRQGCNCNKIEPEKEYPKQLIQIIKERDSLLVQAKQIVRQIESEKHYSGKASAMHINIAYQTFGKQIEVDQKLENIWCQTNKRNDSLRFIRQFCAAQLLVSAANYEKTYIKSSFGRSFERGDKGRRIPSSVLSRNLKLLYSPINRHKVFNPKWDNLILFDSLNQMLPKPNYLKSAYYTLVPIGGFSKYLKYNCFQFFGHLVFRHHDVEPGSKKQSRQLARALIEELKPFDIIVTKSTEFITNQVISGNFTHAAIWLGPNKLNRRGNIPRRENRREDQHITVRDKYLAEAITSGVHMGNLKECITNEETVIIRPIDLTPEEERSIVQNIAEMEGKRYDFYFDLESSDRVNCTELVYLAYDFVKWEMDLVMDNWVIYPDNILKTAIASKRFKVVAIIKDGVFTANPDLLEISKLIE